MERSCWFESAPSAPDHPHTQEEDWRISADGEEDLRFR